MRVMIEYDGRVTITPHVISLGEHSLVDVIQQALGLVGDKYKAINAEVDIRINCKSEDPLITIEEDEEC